MLLNQIAPDCGAGSKKAAIVYAVFSLTTDALGTLSCSFPELTLVMIIPLQTLSKLRINMKKKIALSFLFALGSFAMVATIIRCVIALADDTKSLAKIMIWSTIEETVAFLVANGPALRPLLLRGKDGSSDGTSGPNGSRYPRGTTQHDLYELTPKDTGVVGVVSAGDHGRYGGDSVAKNKISVVRTVQVTVNSDYGKKTAGDGTSANSSLYTA